MGPTNCGALGGLPDPLLRLQLVEACKPQSATGLPTAATGNCASDRAQWRQDLQRLQPFEADLALLPVGWGADQKGPMLSGWQHHDGFTVAELQRFKGIRSVGARTGLLTGPLLCFDFDGASAIEYGLDQLIAPDWACTWQVHRDNDANRLKVLFRPTPEQIAQLPDGAEFQGKTITATKTDASKGEALEVFFDGGRQVIVLGEHPSTGGNYYWPSDMGPEKLSSPPEHWWDHALHIAADCRNRLSKGSKPSANRNNTRRLNPCPICGRHNGPGGSALWCEQTRQGLILCMPGSSFSAEGRHGPLRIGQVVDGWALVKRSPVAEGDVLTFKAHEALMPSQRCSRPTRPSRRLSHV